MDNSCVESQIALLQQRIVALEQRAMAKPSQAIEVLPEALEELRTALEELSVTDEELHQQNKALAAAHTVVETERRRYQELFDFAPHGYLVTDLASIIREASRAAIALLAKRQDHVLGRPLALFVVEAERAAFRTLLSRLPQLERVEEWEVHLQLHGGAVFPAALTVATIRNPQGALTGLRWLLHDISQRKQAEEALRQVHANLEHRVAERTAELQQMNAQLQAEYAERQRAAEKAEKAEQALRSSHEELRQLATYLQNAQEQERTRIARELHDDLAQMLTSLRMDVTWLARRAVTVSSIWRERLTNMTCTIDTLGRAVRRIGTELRPNILDALGLVPAIEWQVQEVGQRTGLTYTVQIPTEELSIDQARATALFRIFQEALTNVVRHAEARHVVIRLVQDPEAMRLEVVDNGKGITPEQLTDRASLGLVGMRERARLWGGDVTIQGTPGVGTTVTIWLPCGPSTLGTAGGVVRVLIADDHATVREGIRRFIADTVDLVVSGEACTAPEVLEMVAARTCDVVLLDISLPGRDGLDILKQLKQLYPTLPILMFSVYSEEQYAIRALKTGAAGYVTKNSEPEVLIAALRKVAQGGRYISPALAEYLAMEITTDMDRPLHATLANREYQVLLMLAVGKSVKEIGGELALSAKTVSTYRTRILQKLHLKSTAEIIHYAIAQQLINHRPALASSSLQVG
jgi:PAS domain S-box-containing protein